jgi:hypothetical protein
LLEIDLPHRGLFRRAVDVIGHLPFLLEVVVPCDRQRWCALACLIVGRMAGRRAELIIVALIALNKVDDRIPLAHVKRVRRATGKDYRFR